MFDRILGENRGVSGSFTVGELKTAAQSLDFSKAIGGFQSGESHDLTGKVVCSINLFNDQNLVFFKSHL